MRTTITFDDDVAAALDQLRSGGEGISAIVNALVRRGLAAEGPRDRFKQHTSPMGARIDVADVAEALELLDGPGAR